MSIVAICLLFQLTVDSGIVENYSAFEYVIRSVLSFRVLIPCESSYPFDRIKRLYDINVHGAFFTAREAARIMIPNGGGSIVLVSSMSANVRKFIAYSFVTEISHFAIFIGRQCSSGLYLMPSGQAYVGVLAPR